MLQDGNLINNVKSMLYYSVILLCGTTYNKI